MHALRNAAGTAQVKSKETVKTFEPRRSRPAAATASTDDKSHGDGWRLLLKKLRKPREKSATIWSAEAVFTAIKLGTCHEIVWQGESLLRVSIVEMPDT